MIGNGAGLASRARMSYPHVVEIVAVISVRTVLAVLVVLNLVGLTIAAYQIMRRK
jgi:hypothetical protein